MSRLIVIGSTTSVNTFNSVSSLQAQLKLEASLFPFPVRLSKLYSLCRFHAALGQTDELPSNRLMNNISDFNEKIRRVVFSHRWLN